MGDFFKDSFVKSFSKDNLKELTNEINQKIYSLLSKVTRHNLSGPCLMNFIVDYSNLNVGITFTHRKQDNRSKNIPLHFKTEFNEKIPEEDYNYYYFGDSDKNYSNMLISPDFIISSFPFDISTSLSKIVVDDGFLIFPRSLINFMKLHNKMLFDYLKIEIKNDKLVVDYKLVSNEYKMLKYNDMFENLMELRTFPLEYSRSNEEIKHLFREFDKYKKSYNLKDEENKNYNDIKLKLSDNNELSIFYDFILGKPKEIEAYQIIEPFQESDKVCTAMINVIYNGWCTYYFYKYMKYEGIDY